MVEIVLYTRRDCCLCEEMDAVVAAVGEGTPLSVRHVDIDDDPDLRRQYDTEVPVLFVNGRKAFKYRVSAAELQRRVAREA